MVNSNFIHKLNQLVKVQERLPRRAAVVAVNFSKERFRRKNWVDRTRKPWEKRKRKARGSLMVATGRLKKSIRVLQVGRDFAIIGTDVPYAQAHNDGVTIKKTVTVRTHRRRTKRGESIVKSHPRKMNLTLPPRQFIGSSAILGRRIERLIERDIKKALQ